MTGDYDSAASRHNRARRDALVAHALRLTSKDVAGWHRVPISTYLGKAHNIDPSVVLTVLDEAPELVCLGFMFHPRPIARKLAIRDTSPTPSFTWPYFTKELEFFLAELQTDTVHINVAGAQGGVVLRMRLDFVEDKGRLAIWLACLVEGSKLLEMLCEEAPLVLGQAWSLPLKRPAPDLSPPQVIVWRTSSALEAASAVRAALEKRLGLSAQRIRLSRDVCTPNELDRRCSGQATVQRVRQSQGRRHFAERSCDRCGQPLSEPESVRLGIGPECRKYYSREVLDAIKQPGGEVQRPGAKSPREWLSNLRDTWARGGER